MRKYYRIKRETLEQIMQRHTLVKSKLFNDRAIDLKHTSNSLVQEFIFLDQVVDDLNELN